MRKTLKNRSMELRKKIEEYREEIVKKQMELMEKIEKLITGEL